MRKSLIVSILATVQFLLIPIYAAHGEDAASSPVVEFQDVNESHWAALQIRQAVEKGYVSGFPDGTFKPEQKASRAEFIRMLVDALKLPHVAEGSPWYQPYVAALVETGIHKEKDFRTGYDQSLSRLEMVRLAVRATNPGIDNNVNAADDNWLVFMGTQSGILAGVGAGKLDLQGTSTRAQAVAIIERILNVNAGKKLPVDKYAMSAAELAWHRTNVFTVMPEFFRTQFPFQVEQGIDPIHSWDVNKMTVASKDGKYKGTIDRIIAIDLADPNDPNRYMLGDINRLKWYANGPIGNGIAEGYPVKDQMNSYIIYFDGHMDFSKDAKSYASEMPSFSIYRAVATDQERRDFYNGELNKPARVFVSGISDFPAFIIPKTVKVKYDDLSIQISTPSKNGVIGLESEIVNVAGPGRPYIKP